MAEATVQEGELNEVSPWLERTGWHRYLLNLNRTDLATAIERPINLPSNPEPFETVIWHAMTSVGKICQATVSRSGIFIRMEAVRTEKHQTKHAPLKTYWDQDSIEKRVQPWRQILMFFIRTQKEHKWDSPAYSFTNAQSRAFKKLIDEAQQVITKPEWYSTYFETDQAIPEVMTGIQKACLDFCIELLNQEIRQTEYECALVCALAVLGVDTMGWRDPDSYPPILSSIIKCARFMVVQKAMLLDQVVSQDLEPQSILDFEVEHDSGYDSPTPSSRSYISSPLKRSREPTPQTTFPWSSPPTTSLRQSYPQTPTVATPQSERGRLRDQGCLTWLSKMMDAFMVRGSRGPMQWMLDLRTYGLKVHYNTTARGHIEWSDGNEILYKNLQFSMPQFRSTIHGLLQRSKEILFEQIFILQPDETVPIIPWAKLKDNPSNSQPGWSFLHDQRTVLPNNGQTWMFERISQSDILQEQFLQHSQNAVINEQGFERWTSSVTKFLEQLQALLHFTGGQPARGPELISLRHSNSAKGSHRNIFIEDGLVVFVTRYHKGYALTGDVKVIHRYLPREVGELLVYYLWLALPFQQRMQSLRKTKDALSPYLWSPNLDGRKWNTERLKRILQHQTELGMGQAMTVRDYRDIAIGISRRYLRKSSAFQNDDDKEDEADDIADEQAGHSSHVAGAVYARGMMEMSGVILSKRQQFRASSQEWHEFLGFQLKGQTRVTDNPPAPWAKENQAARIQRWNRLRQADLQHSLQQMTGSSSATFRGVQQQALQAIQSGASPVVAIMPTGMGKSLLFMLPAFIEPRGTTVVVVPLVALRSDMRRRCQELGISCQEWTSRLPPDGHTIVLVTPESALSDNFFTFLSRLKATQQLDRIIIDECHVTLNSSLTFRSKLQQLGRLNGAEAQMVLLTATLPLSSETELWKRMDWSSEDVQVFRTSTVRQNIVYQVLHAPPDMTQSQEDQLLVNLVTKVVGKVVIYCNTVHKVERIVAAKLFKCEAFHSKLQPRKKEKTLQRFQQGLCRVIVSTSALGLGIDIPDIRLVLHVDEPRDLLEYAQQSGRAGRDGSKSMAVILKGRYPGQDPLVQQLVHNLVPCRRQPLDSYLDGETKRDHCQPDEEACDRCSTHKDTYIKGQSRAATPARMSRRGSMLEGSPDQIQFEDMDEQSRSSDSEPIFFIQKRKQTKPRQETLARVQADAQRLDNVKQYLHAWKGRCLICHGNNHDANHIVTKCQIGKGLEAAKAYNTWKNRIRFEDYGGCYKCGVPQSMCNRWEDNEAGGWKQTKEPCQFFGILLAVVLSFGHSRYWEMFGAEWIRKLQSQGLPSETQEGLMQYLGRRQDNGRTQALALFWEFLWIVEKISEEI